MSAPVREGQTFAGESLFVRYVNFVKLPHTLFALPFALLGVLAASRVAPIGVRTVALVVVAFSAARWAAMGFNRVADLRFDARNPRTRNRELPRGALTLAQAWPRGCSTRSASCSARSRSPGCWSTVSPSGSPGGRTSGSG